MVGYQNSFVVKFYRNYSALMSTVRDCITCAWSRRPFLHPSHHSLCRTSALKRCGLRCFGASAIGVESDSTSIYEALYGFQRAYSDEGVSDPNSQMGATLFTSLILSLSMFLYFRAQDLAWTSLVLRKALRSVSIWEARLGPAAGMIPTSTTHRPHSSSFWDYLIIRILNMKPKKEL